MNVWSSHPKVASNDQAHPELSFDTLHVVVVSNGVTQRQINLVLTSNLVSHGA